MGKKLIDGLKEKKETIYLTAVGISAQDLNFLLWLTYFPSSSTISIFSCTVEYNSMNAFQDRYCVLV